MKLDYFYSGKSSGKVSRQLDYEAFVKLLEEPRLDTLVAAFRAGDAEAKKQLPCVCYMGRSTTGNRKANEMEPTGLVMVDIDHCEHPRECLAHVQAHLGSLELLLAHITPSGKGLRLVLRNIEGCETIEQNLEAIAAQIQVGDYGDVDTCCKDLTRVSFLVPKEEVLYLSPHLFSEATVYVKNFGDNPQGEAKPKRPPEDGGSPQPNDEIPFEESQEYADFAYNGFLVKEIIEKYCLHECPPSGRPDRGKVHMFYNQMAKDFRNLCDNDPKILHALLPRFGHSYEETLSQCRSICQRNNTDRHSKNFYFFLKDNGYYRDKMQQQQVQEMVDVADENPNAELDALIERMPKKLPPVFREYINTAPQYFKIPMVFALAPVMGTLTSYLGAYYMDGEYHTTSFNSVIYAPPSSGKSFVKRVVKRLMADIVNRDLVSAAREDIYSTAVNRKGSNEKAPEDPRVTCRNMPAINSLPEVLNKQRNNGGYHMFTFTEEMDTWKKGSKAQGDKNDLYRIAWDNGEYGQAYKSTGTFKGIVQLYWNVLITGTPRQVLSYFNDVENGMVTRCGFCDLGDQRFAPMPIFKPLSKQDNEVIDRFMARCDENTYVEPLGFDTNRLYDIKPEAFDKEVPWRFEFRPRQTVDMSWIFKDLERWGQEQSEKAARASSDAWEVFRRRCMVRGFRMALLCTALYPNITEKEKRVIRDFVLWYLDCDIYQIRKLFEQSYNDLEKGEKTQPSKGQYTDLFSKLNDEFTVFELMAVLANTPVNSPPPTIIYRWTKRGMVEKIAFGRYKKVRDSGI